MASAPICAVALRFCSSWGAPLLAFASIFTIIPTSINANMTVVRNLVCAIIITNHDFRQYGHVDRKPLEVRSGARKRTMKGIDTSAPRNVSRLRVAAWNTNPNVVDSAIGDTHGNILPVQPGDCDSCRRITQHREHKPGVRYGHAARVCPTDPESVRRSHRDTLWPSSWASHDQPRQKLRRSNKTTPGRPRPSTTRRCWRSR